MVSHQVSAGCREAVVKEAVCEQLRGDPFLRSSLRAPALAYADRFAQNPDELRDASWQVVRQPGLAAPAYRRALRQAREVCLLIHNDGFSLGARGVALCRVGNRAEALNTLTQSE
jgi:hypothetical protein